MSARHGVALAAALLVALTPGVVIARQAQVAVFEAFARAEPAEDAKILEVLAEGAVVSVSEEAEGGWLRVRLASGGVGWLSEASVRAYRGAAPTVLRRPPTAAPAPPAPARTSPPSADASLEEGDDVARVTSLTILRELVVDDEVVLPQVQDLRASQVASRWWLWGGLGLGATLLVAGRVSPPDVEGEASGDGLMMAGGALVALASVIIHLAVRPKEAAIQEVVDTWNQRHPDPRFELDL